MWSLSKVNRGKKPGKIATTAVGMDIQDERRRLLDAEGGDPTGLMSEQDAYLRSV